MAKVTVAHLNTRIGNLLRAGEESDGSDGGSGDSSDDSSDETDSNSDASARRRERKNKKKAGKGKKDRKDLDKAMRVIGNLEERIKKMEAGGQADTFAAQAAYAPNATNYIIVEVMGQMMGPALHQTTSIRVGASRIPFQRATFATIVGILATFISSARNRSIAREGQGDLRLRQPLGRDKTGDPGADR